MDQYNEKLLAEARAERDLMMKEAREIKENVILKVNKNFDSTGKSDEAINATFDFAVETLQGMAQTETALVLVENSVKEAVKEESVIVTDFTKYRNYGGKN